MSKIKLTKGELKRQRDSLKQFRHYLPTLLLKKQQLQMKIQEVRKLIVEKTALLEDKEKSISRWTGLLADPQLIPLMDLKTWVVPEDVDIGCVNIAGANLPVLEAIKFQEIDYDFYTAPFWVDQGIVELRALITFLIEVTILKRQMATLEHELRVTTQRVNLFEKIKIPECLDNIRIIRIYLGDQMANAVGIGKVAKKKLEMAAVAGG